MTPETKLGRDVREAVCRRPGCVVWRNARGFDERARTSYGLAAGGADYIGIANGRFIAIETKVRPRVATPEQEAFLSGVRRRGGLACVAYTVADAMALVDLAFAE